MITDIEWREEIEVIKDNPLYGKIVLNLWAYDEFNGWFKVPTRTRE